MIRPSFTVWPPPFPVAAGVLPALLPDLVLRHAPSAAARAIVTPTAMIRLLISPPARKTTSVSSAKTRGPGPGGLALIASPESHGTSHDQRDDVAMGLLGRDELAHLAAAP